MFRPSPPGTEVQRPYHPQDREMTRPGPRGDTLVSTGGDNIGGGLPPCHEAGSPRGTLPATRQFLPAARGSPILGMGSVMKHTAILCGIVLAACGSGSKGPSPGQ